MHQQQKCDAFVVAWVTNANDMHVFFALDFPPPLPFLGVCVCVTVQLVQIRNNSIATSPAPVSMVINISWFDQMVPPVRLESQAISDLR